ncbi:hypothetical protein FIBSPDRAFT_863945 [Athelia psychrophila]|uniref:Uncharacterized protein n=1 Tax=Athelia psychrophila TaxID=1759441 RepID=A0A166GXQ1_9AGAM|nr:hypothetical protein FIBSPDRAFT_874313 [Fibularhizoctonia sp. CBS 109695]KZP18269.1 hypothetical protein FIBSPDRAFT_863945 [Fibularhizoctonia sp. CBS 109695]
MPIRWEPEFPPLSRHIFTPRLPYVQCISQAGVYPPYQVFRTRLTCSRRQKLAANPRWTSTLTKGADNEFFITISLQSHLLPLFGCPNVYTYANIITRSCSKSRT